MYGANIHANGIRQHYLHFRRAGDIRPYGPLVVIPGITSPAASWAFVGQELGKHVETYILDVRGRGLSEASAGLNYDLDTLADDVIAFAAALGLERWSIVGHSMGARIALRASRQRPDGLSRLVLVDPPMSGPNRRAYPARLSDYLDAIAHARRGASAESFAKALPTWSLTHLRTRAEWLHTCDVRAVTEAFVGFGTDDIHVDIGHLSIPTLLVSAERGGVVTPEDVEEIAQLAPNVTHVRVPDAGHMIPWDNEPGFYRALEGFLDIRFDEAARG
ncbi:MAG: alpha/beta fold hydrolase [Pseudorhodoplanes sp.]|uniref:alpha/beta fold hydrolase n=1 Tax=Pseudorhodoplanes sp. TaxID=1934341 RepID=UPI003D118600